MGISRKQLGIFFVASYLFVLLLINLLTFSFIFQHGKVHLYYFIDFTHFSLLMCNFLPSFLFDLYQNFFI